MDSELIRNSRIVFLVDRVWREDVSKLPEEDVYVSPMHLPDPEPDNCNPNETLKEIDQKWSDLRLNSLLNKTNTRLN